MMIKTCFALPRLFISDLKGISTCYIMSSRVINTSQFRFFSSTKKKELLWIYWNVQFVYNVSVTTLHACVVVLRSAQQEQQREAGEYFLWNGQGHFSAALLFSLYYRGKINNSDFTKRKWKTDSGYVYRCGNGTSRHRRGRDSAELCLRQTTSSLLSLVDLFNFQEGGRISQICRM